MTPPKKDISVTTASLIAIITFLIGGFFGDWKASYELKQIVMQNGIVANEAKANVAVVVNSIRNIERSIDKMETDLRDLKQTQ